MLFPDLGDDRRSAVARFLMDRTDAEIRFDCAQRVEVGIPMIDFAWLYHVSKKYGVDVICRFLWGFAFVERNNDQGVLSSVRWKPIFQKVLEPGGRCSKIRVMPVVVQIG